MTLKSLKLFLQSEFSRFNASIFKSDLANLRISTRKNNEYRGEFIGEHRYGPIIFITQYQQFSKTPWPKKYLRYTLIHEMIHYYLWSKNINEDPPHNRIFQQWHKEIFNLPYKKQSRNLYFLTRKDY